MTNPTSGWDSVPVYGRWLREPESGDPMVGSIELLIEERINLADGSAVYPAGFKRTATIGSDGRITTTCPANDDPNIVQHGWSMKVIEKFDDGRSGRTYNVQPTLAHLALTPPGLNLSAVIAEASASPTVSSVRGAPGGVAGLDADGDVIDADGVKVTAGGTTAAAVFAAIIPRGSWTAGVAYPMGSLVEELTSGRTYLATSDRPASSTFNATGWAGLGSVPGAV